MIFIKAMKCIALGLASLPIGGCAIAAGIVFAALIKAEAYAPELGNILFTRAITAFGLIETFTALIFVLVGLIISL